LRWILGGRILYKPPYFESVLGARVAIERLQPRDLCTHGIQVPIDLRHADERSVDDTLVIVSEDDVDT